MSDRLVFESAWPWLALLVALPLVVWVARTSRAALAPGPQRTLLALRVAAMVAVAAALSQPAWLATSDRVSVVYALDVSRSVDPAFVEAAIAWMERAQADPRAQRQRFFAFADRPVEVDSPAAVRALKVSTDRDRADAVDTTATDVEAMLDTAAAAFGATDLKRVVLMT
ncbi:MAG: hypothetical protein MUF30_12165, partial [Burkholderiales bacterium]|nr:hypothetical protein [Burkholderiales bacterium]